MPVTMQVLEQTKFGAIFTDVIHNSTFEGVFGYRDLVDMALDEKINGIAISAPEHGFGLTAVVFVDGKPDCVMMLDNHGSFLLDRAGQMLEELGSFELFGVDAERLKNHRNRLDAVIGQHKPTGGVCATDPRDEIVRLRQENALLSRKEALYRTLVEDASSIVMQVDRYGYILFVNEFGRELFGLKPAVGRHVGVLCPENDVPGEDFCTRIAGVFAGSEERFAFECRHAAAGGRVCWIAWTGSVQRSTSGTFESVVCTGNDISGLQSAQEELVRAEARSRMLLEHAPNMILVNRNGRIAYANKKCEEILGYSRDELSAPSFFFLDLVAPEDAGAVAAFAGMDGSPSQATVECTFLAKGGRRLDAIVSGERVSCDGERALLGVITDITGRKLSEWNLRQSRQLYRAIFETTGAATMIVDGDGSVALANAEFERMFGYMREELEGKKAYQLLFRGDDREKLTRYHRMRRLETEKAPRSYEANLIDKAGDSRSVLMTASLIPGTAQSVVSLMDITDRKRAEEALREKEERYRIIAENAKDVIWTMNLDLRFTYISPSVTPLLGYTPDEMLNFSVDQFLSGESAAYARRLLLEEYSRLAEREGEDGRNVILEFECTKRDGSGVWVEARVSFLRDEERRVRGIVGVANDIRQRKDEERVRREALDQIEKNMEQFAILNDHIRNPLQAIVGLVDLEGGPLADKVVSQAAEIDAIIKQLDIGWLESKKISDFLRKHYRMN